MNFFYAWFHLWYNSLIHVKYRTKTYYMPRNESKRKSIMVNENTFPCKFNSQPFLDIITSHSDSDSVLDCDGVLNISLYLHFRWDTLFGVIRDEFHKYQKLKNRRRKNKFKDTIYRTNNTFKKFWEKKPSKQKSTEIYRASKKRIKNIYFHGILYWHPLPPPPALV